MKLTVMMRANKSEGYSTAWYLLAAFFCFRQLILRYEHRGHVDVQVASRSGRVVLATVGAIEVYGMVHHHMVLFRLGRWCCSRDSLWSHSVSSTDFVCDAQPAGDPSPSGQDMVRVLSRSRDTAQFKMSPGVGLLLWR